MYRQKLLYTRLDNQAQGLYILNRSASLSLRQPILSRKVLHGSQQTQSCVFCWRMRKPLLWFRIIPIIRKLIHLETRPGGIRSLEERKMVLLIQLPPCDIVNALFSNSLIRSTKGIPFISHAIWWIPGVSLCLDARSADKPDDFVGLVGLISA
jgi:hypothetical protein